MEDQRVTLIPDSYPELENEIYISLEDETERQTLLDIVPVSSRNQLLDSLVVDL